AWEVVGTGAAGGVRGGALPLRRPNGGSRRRIRARLVGRGGTIHHCCSVTVTALSEPVSATGGDTPMHFILWESPFGALSGGFQRSRSVSLRPPSAVDWSRLCPTICSEAPSAVDRQRSTRGQDISTVPTPTTEIA